MDNCHLKYIAEMLSCMYAWPHTWWSITCMSIMPLRLMYVLKLLYTIKSFKNTWKFHVSLFLCIVYICACIFFWLISFYLWLVLVFLFSRIYYGFTPLRHQTSWHYTSQQCCILVPLLLAKFLRQILTYKKQWFQAIHRIFHN